MKNVTEMKASVPDDFRGDIDRLVDDKNRSLEDRKHRIKT